MVQCDASVSVPMEVRAVQLPQIFSVTINDIQLCRFIRVVRKLLNVAEPEISAKQPANELFIQPEKSNLYIHTTFFLELLTLLPDVVSYFQDFTVSFST
jgi:hypothetical protein